MLHLARDSRCRRSCARIPKIIPEAVEEMLRRYTFTVPVRFVAKDVVYRGRDDEGRRAGSDV